ncbi:MAG TPA: neutral zinc metallopeptidase [Micromonosporaceae bacterium]
MELNENARIDTDQVRDIGSSGGGGGLRGLPIPIGGGRGWIGLIVLAVMVIGGFVGGNTLLDGGSGDAPESSLQCGQDNPDRLQDVKCRNALYVNSIQNYWQSALPERFGTGYQGADTTFFQQSVNTGCGLADSGVGPFYCPNDDLVYIDLRFWNQLAGLGAPGEFAQPYVLAHEYGHHIQDLLGTEAAMRRAQQRDPDNANRYSVMLELQADCYAGVWTRHATSTTDAGGQPLFKSITQRDIDEALQAAASVGDDAIQKKMGGRVDESKFTHGTSAQRQQWFKTGYATGDPKACDTFNRTS